MAERFASIILSKVLEAPIRGYKLPDGGEWGEKMRRHVLRVSSTECGVRYSGIC